MKRIVIIIFIIISCLSLSLCTFFPSSNHSNNEIQTSHKYIIEIIINQNLNYTIFVPVPLEWNKNEQNSTEVSEVINQLKIINGTADFSIVETEKGFALKIIGNDNIKIEGKTNVQSTVSTNPLTLSVSNYTVKEKNRKYWIFTNFQDNNIEMTISIQFYMIGKHGGEEISINESLINGWQQVNGTYSKLVKT